MNQCVRTYLTFVRARYRGMLYSIYFPYEWRLCNIWSIRRAQADRHSTIM